MQGAVWLEHVPRHATPRRGRPDGAARPCRRSRRSSVPDRPPARWAVDRPPDWSGGICVSAPRCDGRSLHCCQYRPHGWRAGVRHVWPPEMCRIPATSTVRSARYASSGQCRWKSAASSSLPANTCDTRPGRQPAADRGAGYRRHARRPGRCLLPAVGFEIVHVTVGGGCQGLVVNDFSRCGCACD